VGVVKSLEAKEEPEQNRKTVEERYSHEGIGEAETGGFLAEKYSSWDLCWRISRSTPTMPIRSWFESCTT